MTRKIAPLLAGLALAGGLAFGGASLASAQDSTTTTEPSTETTAPSTEATPPADDGTTARRRRRPARPGRQLPRQRQHGRLEQLRQQLGSSSSSAES